MKSILLITLVLYAASIECVFIDELIEASNLLQIVKREDILKACASIEKENHRLNDNRPSADSSNSNQAQTSSSKNGASVKCHKKMEDKRKKKQLSNNNMLINALGYMTRVEENINGKWDSRMENESGRLRKTKSKDDCDRFKSETSTRKINLTDNSERSMSEPNNSQLSQKKNISAKEVIDTNITERKIKDKPIKGNKKGEDNVEKENQILSGDMLLSTTQRDIAQQQNTHLVLEVVSHYCTKELESVKSDIKMLKLEKSDFDLGLWTANYPRKLKREIKALREEIKIREINRSSENDRRQEIREMRKRVAIMRNIRHYFYSRISDAWNFEDERQTEKNTERFCEVVLPEKLQALRGTYRLSNEKGLSSFVICELSFELICKNPLILYLGAINPGPNAIYAIGIKEERTDDFGNNEITVVDYVSVDFDTSVIKSISYDIVGSHALSDQRRPNISFNHHLGGNRFGLPIPNIPRNRIDPGAPIPNRIPWPDRRPGRNPADKIPNLHPGRQPPPTNLLYRVPPNPIRYRNLDGPCIIWPKKRDLHRL